MNSSSSSAMANGGGDQTVIAIPATNNIQMTSLEQRIEETRWLLQPSAGKKSCCIFRVPQCFVEINSKSYRPSIVSIGPYHHGEPNLEMMQQHKWRFLHHLLARTPSPGPTLDDYRQLVASREDDIRKCYSETIHFCKADLVDMMVLDGLFIIELFCKAKDLPPSHRDDPIFCSGWIFPTLIRDLLLLENQIPFFLLQTLFDNSKTSREDSDSSLTKFALEFCNSIEDRPDQVLEQHFSVEGKHLLDLFRLSAIPQPQEEMPENTSSALVQFIKSAKKLHLAGIKFKTREANSFLDVKFCNGVLEIPYIILDDTHTHIFLNFVAFEQCSSRFHCSKHVTNYAAFMSCLIRTPTDAAFLCDKNIVMNYLANEEEVVHFFTKLGKEVSLDIEEKHLSKLFNDVNEYHRNTWRVQWAGFRFKYFDTPWSFLSALAAVILLLFTAIQAFFAFYAYVRPPQSGGGGNP